MTTQEQKLFDSQEVKVWTLSIPFRSPLIKRAKELGAKWDSVSKVWIVSCKHCELAWEGLDCKIVKNNTSNNNIEDNFGTGCITTKEKAMRYGYDAIER